MAPAALRHSEKPWGWPAQSSNKPVNPEVEMPQFMGMEWEILNTVDIMNTPNLMPGLHVMRTN